MPIPPAPYSRWSPGSSSVFLPTSLSDRIRFCPRRCSAMRNIIVFESIVELVAVDRPEVAGNLREDIALLEGGTLPTSSMLALAPSLDRWLSLVGVGVIQLAG